MDTFLSKNEFPANKFNIIDYSPAKTFFQPPPIHENVVDVCVDKRLVHSYCKKYNQNVLASPNQNIVIVNHDKGICRYSWKTILTSV